MTSTWARWKTCWRPMNGPIILRSRWCAWMRSPSLCTPMCDPLRPPHRAGKPDTTTNTSAAARPTSSVRWNPKRADTFYFSHPEPFRGGVRAGGVSSDGSVPGRENDPPHRGQPQYPRPEVADGFLRSGEGQPTLGSVHSALHPGSWKLAQSGGDRNRPVFPAVPRSPKNSESSDAPSGEPCLESSDEPHPHQN